MALLRELCKDGKLDEVAAALARGEDMNDKDSYGRTALMLAVWKRHNSIVKLLLDQPGVKINMKNNLGRNALHLAAYVNNREGARMLLLHPTMDSDSANAKDGLFETAVMVGVRKGHKEVLMELVAHGSVSLDIGNVGEIERPDLLSIVNEARTRRAQVPSQGASSQSGANQLSRKRKGNDLNDSLSQCRERCRQELKELRKHQNERVQLLLQQNREKEQAFKAENEKTLALLIQDNEAQEALMVAKHDEEETAVRRATELEAERNASSTSRPHIPVCPVCLEEMIPPTRIFQCRNGHLVCETCKSGLKPCICPKCRQEMTGRATDMEDFLRSLHEGQ